MAKMSYIAEVTKYMLNKIVLLSEVGSIVVHVMFIRYISFIPVASVASDSAV